MQLSKYPEKIANLQKQLLEARLRHESLKELQMSYEAGIKTAIASDPSLKNETQRKAKETELKADQSSDYCDVTKQVKTEKIVVLQLEINLQLYRDRFSVSKLEKREQIAQLEIMAA